MLKKLFVLILCLFLIVPVASAFSLSEFFKDFFGSEDSLTGAVVGRECRTDRDCVDRDEVCSGGKCTVECRDTAECWKKLEVKRVANFKELYDCVNSVCAVVKCGDKKVEGDEVCDDGNGNNKDGCSSTCQVENGWTCKTKAPKASSCTKDAVCGNGNVEVGETCDGNKVSCPIAGGYTASKTCNNSCNGWGSCTTSESCGDGTENGNEDCDDGNSVNTDSCTNSCADPECGDNICSVSEDCSSCSSDCGECYYYASEPVIDFSISSPAVANLFSVSKLNISNATQCAVSVSELNALESATQRGKEAPEVTIRKKKVTCSSAKSEVQTILRALGNGDFRVTAFGTNTQGVISKTVPLIIRGAAVEIKNLNTEYYYTDQDPPIVKLDSISANSCTYQVNDESAVSFTCSNGLNQDLASSSKQGVNQIKIVATVSGTPLSYTKQYHYVSDADLASEIIESFTGGGGPTDPGSAGLVLGDAANSNFVEPADATAAITMAMLNLKSQGGKVSLHEGNKLLDLIKDNEKIRNQIGAIATATNLETLKFSVIRSAQLTSARLTEKLVLIKKTYDSNRDDESSWSSKEQKSRQFTIQKRGEDRISIKIK